MKIIGIFRYINGNRCPSCGCDINLSDKPALCSSCCSLWEKEREEAEKNTVKKNQTSDAIHGMVFLTYYKTKYNSPSKKMILELKKHNYRDIYEFLAFHLSNRLLENYKGCPRDTVIVNVPRSRQAVVKYGFDQSELLAHSVSDMMGLKYVSAIGYKTGRMFIMQKELSLKERRMNALEAYTIQKKKIPLIFGKRCILIDDICTTGATLSACAELLDNNGAKYVDCAVIAKTE